MNINYHKNFIKQFKLRIEPNPKLDKKLHQRLNLFVSDRTNPLLKDHQLSGDKSEYRAFSVTGDIRVIYKQSGNGIMLYAIGSHNQVY